MPNKIAEQLRLEIEELVRRHLKEACEKIVRRSPGEKNRRVLTQKVQRSSEEVTAVEAALLSEIEKQPGQKIGALRESTGYSGKTLYRSVDRLIKKGRVRAVGTQGTKTYFPL